MFSLLRAILDFVAVAKVRIKGGKCIFLGRPRPTSSYVSVRERLEKLASQHSIIAESNEVEAPVRIDFIHRSAQRSILRYLLFHLHVYIFDAAYSLSLGLFPAHVARVQLLQQPAVQLYRPVKGPHPLSLALWTT